MDRLQRQRTAATMVHQSVEAQTADHMDHTFAGVMFDVRAARKLPYEYLEISTVWVRGGMGPMTVWSAEGGFCGKREDEEAWTRNYQATHQQSFRELVPMQLHTPIRIKPGVTMGIYTHSACLGDEQIVYANQRHKISLSDMFLDILPGIAHLSHEPFSPTHQNWGGWGSPWRERREFVGRVSYGIRWLRWNLDTHNQLPPLLRKMAWAVMMSRHPRARNSLLYCLDDDHIFYILNNIDWWDMPSVQRDLKDAYGGEHDKERRRRKRSKAEKASKQVRMAEGGSGSLQMRRKRRREAAAAAEEEEEEEEEAAAAAAEEEDWEDWEDGF